LLNARLALDIPKYGVTLEAWGKNLTDRKYIVGATDITDALGLGNAYLSNPVTFGFDVIKRF
jgi:outer membrane receptor protein involved in Fe transport